MTHSKSRSTYLLSLITGAAVVLVVDCVGLAAATLATYTSASEALSVGFIVASLTLFVGSLVIAWVDRRRALSSYAVGDIRHVWSVIPTGWRLAIIASVVAGGLMVAVGGHVQLEAPELRNGHPVATRYGKVVRNISYATYHDLQMGHLRAFLWLAAIFAAMSGALAIGARRARQHEA